VHRPVKALSGKKAVQGLAVGQVPLDEVCLGMHRRPVPLKEVVVDGDPIALADQLLEDLPVLQDFQL